jgi:hypothetical protein
MLVTCKLNRFEVLRLVLMKISCPVGCYPMLTWHNIPEDLNLQPLNLWHDAIRVIVYLVFCIQPHSVPQELR